MALKCKDMAEFMKKLAPEELAEKWDNCGLNIGRPESEVKKVLVALDATTEVVDEAISLGADMIITHHPFILFRDIKKITDEDDFGRRVYKLIQNGISVYCAHTSLDIVKGGINDKLADLFNLKNTEILTETGRKNLFAISVYVPKYYANDVKQAMEQAGAGGLGNYSGCFFTSEGEGEFTPLEGSKPFVGKQGEKKTVDEVKIEAIAEPKFLNAVVSAMLKAHPYEQASYNIVSTQNMSERFGIGRIGELENEVAFEDFAVEVKKLLGLDSMRIVGDKKKKIKKAALCSGAGAEFISLAAEMGADCYVTSDIKFHEAQKAEELGLCIIDGTHFATENIIAPYIKKYLENCVKEKGETAEIICSEVDGQTFDNI